MKTIKKQIEEIIDRPINDDPNKEDQIKIKRLEDIVIKLAQQIDILIDIQR
jgi:hypothetical protein